MAIQYNENIKIAAPNPLDWRYLSSRTYLGSQLPYSATTEVNSKIIQSERFTGLTVNVNGVEYWYKDGVLNTDLIEKKYDSTIPEGDFVTGGTNLGFFSGKTGIQTLPVTNLADSTYNGNYISIYNNYYLDSDGIVHVGASPIDSINRRGYVKTSGSVKSLIWSDYVSGLYLRGWILLTGNISELIGTSVLPYLYTYYDGTTTFPHVNNTWTEGVSYNNGSDMVVSTVLGSTTTGSTITIGGPVYSHTDNNLIHFRTISTQTPEHIKVSYDDAFVYLSGTSAVLDGGSKGIGESIYIGQTGNTLYFKSVVGSGGTAVSTSGDTLIIYSTGGTDAGTYNLSSPAAIDVGGILTGTELTGKTSFELFEMLLVPTLEPSFVDPYNTFALSNTGLFEVNCNITPLTMTAGFNQGSIDPVYCGGPSLASGLPLFYNFTGTGLSSTGTSLLSISCTIAASYNVPIGAQTWSNSVTFDDGQPPLDSKGGILPAYPAGTTGNVSQCIEGVYPIYGTTSSISSLTKQSLNSMLTGNNIQITLVPETGGNKHKFEIPCAWLSSRPLVGIKTFNSVANAWCYEGSTAIASLTKWDESPSTETVQSLSIGYCRYTYNGIDRSTTYIRLEF